MELTEKRKDAQLAREIELSLPRELSHEQRLELVRSFVEEQFVNRGMVADFALHCPKASDGKDQPHAHVMLTLRPLKPDGSGFGNKERAWNDRALLELWREEWAVAVDQALADAESAERIDHRTLKAQGIARSPLPHLPQPFAAGRLEHIAAHLMERLNRWQAARSRKLALQILESLQGNDLVSWGMIAAQQEMSLFERETSYGFERR